MKRIRSTGLILITAGLLSTSGPTWAAGSSTNRSPVHPGISASALSGALDAFGGLWNSLLAGFQAILGDGSVALAKGDVAESGSDPDTVDPEPQGGTGPLYPDPGGGCIDPNGIQVYVMPCPYS